MSFDPPEDDPSGPDPLLAAAMEGVSDAFYVLDADWRIVLFNASAEAYFGMARELVLGQRLWDVFPQADDNPYAVHARRAMETRNPIVFEAPSRWRRGHTVELRMTPMIGGGLGVAVQDITDRKKAEAARDLMMREVDHRSRNLIAVVQAIVRLTKADGLEAYKEAVHGRLDALARAQSMLAGRRGEDAPVGELIGEALAALASPDSYSLEGAEALLRTAAAQPVSMIVHELATNASKYGALSQPDGRVSVSWRGEKGMLLIEWRETGGPPVTAPKTTGFGSRLIDQLTAQMEGQAALDWLPEGLTARIWVPLSH